MRVIVGPVSVASAKAWIRYAQEALFDLDDAVIAEETRAVFDDYLDEWGRVARATDPFHWEADIPAEAVEYHMHVFRKIAEVLAEQAEQEGARRAPAASDEFYVALLNGVLNALAAEGPSHAEFAQSLSDIWPGVEREGDHAIRSRNDR